MNIQYVTITCTVLDISIYTLYGMNIQYVTITCTVFSIYIHCMVWTCNNKCLVVIFAILAFELKAVSSELVAYIKTDSKLYFYSKL